MDAVLQLDGCYYLLPYKKSVCKFHRSKRLHPWSFPKWVQIIKFPIKKLLATLLIKPWKHHTLVCYITLICTGYRQHLPNEVILLICSKIWCLRRLRGCLIHTPPMQLFVSRLSVCIWQNLVNEKLTNTVFFI